MTEKQEFRLDSGIVKLLDDARNGVNIDAVTKQIQKDFLGFTNEAYYKGLNGLRATDARTTYQRMLAVQSDEFQMNNYITRLANAGIDDDLKSVLNDMKAFVDMSIEKAFMLGQEYSLNKDLDEFLRDTPSGDGIERGM